MCKDTSSVVFLFLSKLFPTCTLPKTIFIKFLVLFFVFNRHNRAEVIRSLGWMIEPPLPEQIQEKLSSSEKEYSKTHSATIKSYQSEMDLDLAVVIVLSLSLQCLQRVQSQREPFSN